MPSEQATAAAEHLVGLISDSTLSFPTSGDIPEIAAIIDAAFAPVVAERDRLAERVAGMNEVFGAIRMAVGQNVMGSDAPEEPDYDAPWLPCGLLVRIDSVMDQEHRK